MAGLLSYLRLFHWFTLRQLRRHPVRSLTVLLGIALGAAVFASVRLAVYATIDSFSRSMNLVAGTGDYSLVRPGGRVPDALVAVLLRQTYVRAASPVLSTYVRPAGRAEAFLLMGFDPILDRDFHAWAARPRAGGAAPDWVAMMTEPNTLLIGARLSKQFGWQPGSKVALSHTHQTMAFKIQGILDRAGLALVEGGRIALCDIATFQEFTGLFGVADRIDILLKPDAARHAVADLQSILPAGVAVRSPSEARESGRGMIKAYQFSLTFLSFISLFVGMFLIYSLVALNAAARRHELAVLRSVGASAHTLFFLFVGEGAVLGLCGWLLALPLSGFLVRYVLAAVSRTVSMLFVRVQVDRLTLSSWEIALSFAVTLGVAILAALQPAREAMGVPPREALDISPSADIRPHLTRNMALSGIGMLVLVYPISRLPSPPAISLPGYAAALVLFLGFALLAPWGLRVLSRSLTPHLLRLGSQPAFLAARYLRQSGVQTAIAVGALITAVALFTALVIMIHSFRGTVALWVRQSIGGDLYVRPKLAELNRFRDPLPPQAVAAIRSLPEPVQLVPVRRLELTADGHRHIFEAMNYAAYSRHSRFIWMNGDARRIEAGLNAGKGVVVSEVFANTTGLGAGDRYRVRIGTGTLDVPILGVFRDYRTRGGVVYYSLAHFQKRFGDNTWSALQINFESQGIQRRESIARVRRRLSGCCGDVIEMLNGQDLRAAVLRIFDETFAITSVLLLIALVVAALGIASTLAVLVLQRSRQLNTIRAVGGSRTQLRRMIEWEAALIVTTGLAGGLACGFALSYLLIFVVNLQSFGWTFLYRIDWQALLLAMPLIFTAALLAALPAVKLALKASPADLLRGELR